LALKRAKKRKAKKKWGETNEGRTKAVAMRTGSGRGNGWGTYVGGEGEDVRKWEDSFYGARQTNETKEGQERDPAKKNSRNHHHTSPQGKHLPPPREKKSVSSSDLRAQRSQVAYGLKKMEGIPA